MAYVNKNEALKLLSNPNDFNVYKNMYIKMYDNKIKEKLKNYKESNQLDDLYENVNKLGKLSSNIGSAILNMESNKLLDEINRGSIDSTNFSNYLEMLDYIYNELKMIK